MRRRRFVASALGALAATAAGVTSGNQQDGPTCGACGATLRPGSRFCSSCGARQGHEAGSGSPSPLSRERLEASLFSVRNRPGEPFSADYALLGTAVAVAPRILVTDYQLALNPDSPVPEVRAADGRRLDARLLHRDHWTGTIFLELGEEVTPLAPAPPESSRIGTGIQVGAYQQDRGARRELVLVHGIISGQHRFGNGLRPFEDYLQSDAIVPEEGGLGAAVLDAGGRLVALASGLTPYFQAHTGIERVSGINMLLPMSEPMRILAAVQAGEPADPSWLGLMVQPVEEAMAFSVRYTYPGHPAAAAFQRGDVVRKVGDTVASAGNLPALQTAAARARETVSVMVDRGGRPLSLEVAVAPFPVHPRLEALDTVEWLTGYRLEPVEGADWRVQSLTPEAEEREGSRGVRLYDRVKTVNDRKVRTYEDLQTAVEAGLDRHKAEISILFRDRDSRTKTGFVRRRRLYYLMDHPLTL